jgi:hypothetical protein
VDAKTRSSSSRERERDEETKRRSAVGRFVFRARVGGRDRARLGDGASTRARWSARERCSFARVRARGTMGTVERRDARADADDG